MNSLEKLMLEFLRKGREHYGITAVRAEFEAEGARSDELLRLMEICYRADLDLVIKIGGCEAITSLHHAKLLGAKTLIAPMIESPYALQKYAQAVEQVYQDARIDVEAYFNIETIQAFQQKETLAEEATRLGLTGIVFGRFDFAGSMGLGRQELNGQRVTDMVLEVSRLCLKHNLGFILGGGIAAESLGVVRQIADVFLTRFETRKVAFDPALLHTAHAEEALLQAAHFELLWLQNKQNYYKMLAYEDQVRIEMLSRRLKAVA